MKSPFLDNTSSPNDYDSFIKGAEVVGLVKEPTVPVKKTRKKKVPPLPDINLPAKEYEKQLNEHNKKYKPKQINISERIKTISNQVEIEEEPEVDHEESTVNKKTVVFSNNFGSIKVKVLDVLESDNFGLCLVFASDDDMTFIPKAGEPIQFKNHDGEEFEVYFHNLVFDWTDGIKKVMILVKSISFQSYDGEST